MTGSILPADVVAVIPARHASQRLPGKPLLELEGRPLLAHVIEKAQRAGRVGTVLVATDHDDIARVARQAGAEAVMTRADHPSGSDRIGEAIRDREESIVLNVQGDEPLIPPDFLDALVDQLESFPDAAVSTLAAPAADEELATPNVVKVVLGRHDRALYFSRAPIPALHPDGDPRRRTAAAALRHVGLYGYRRAALDRFLRLDPSPLEQREGLEQLRLLEDGARIQVALVDQAPPGVDTAEDLERCRQWLASRTGTGQP